MWGCIGGSVLKGENSLQGAVRESKEEIGVDLLPADGNLIFSEVSKNFNDIMDVWLFRYDGEVSLNNATTDEVEQVAWMNKKQIEDLWNKINWLIHWDIFLQK